ncbi:MAG: hypothetical protein JJ975_09190 [Bacteroidia bacterium]|nr:hypothetical protein [Bacteroidia bacterium]
MENKPDDHGVLRRFYYPPLLVGIPLGLLIGLLHGLGSGFSQETMIVVGLVLFVFLFLGAVFHFFFVYYAPWGNKRIAKELNVLGAHGFKEDEDSWSIEHKRYHFSLIPNTRFDGMYLYLIPIVLHSPDIVKQLRREKKMEEIRLFIQDDDPPILIIPHKLTTGFIPRIKPDKIRDVMDYISRKLREYNINPVQVSED